MSEPKWTDADWANWRAENVRLLREGWRLGTNIMLDGTVEEYAEKDGVRIDRSPRWERSAEGIYIYGRVTVPYTP